MLTGRCCRAAAGAPPAALLRGRTLATASPACEGAPWPSLAAARCPLADEGAHSGAPAAGQAGLQQPRQQRWGCVRAGTGCAGVSKGAAFGRTGPGLSSGRFWGSTARDLVAQQGQGPPFCRLSVLCCPLQSPSLRLPLKAPSPAWNQQQSFQRCSRASPLPRSRRPPFTLRSTWGCELRGRSRVGGRGRRAGAGSGAPRAGGRAQQKLSRAQREEPHTSFLARRTPAGIEATQGLLALALQELELARAREAEALGQRTAALQASAPLHQFGAVSTSQQLALQAEPSKCVLCRRGTCSAWATWSGASWSRRRSCRPSWRRGWPQRRRAASRWGRPGGACSAAGGGGPGEAGGL